jgi:chain length determinant protein EpsF
MNFKQLLLLLKLRWWLVLALFSLIVAGTTAVSLVMPKQYTANTQILLDVKTDPILATVMPNLGNPGYVGSQAAMIASERVAGRVVKMLGLAENPVAVEQWREATQARVTLESYYGELLLKGLKVEQLPQSSMLAVAYTGKDPKFAAAVANAFTRAYLDLTVEIRQGPAREMIQFTDDRLRALRAELQSAQDRLSGFQQKKGIIISRERLDQEQQTLSALENELAKALADSASSSSASTQGGTDGSVDVQASVVVQGLKSQLAQAETKLKEVSETLGSKHPVRMQLEAQVLELRQQIEREKRRVSDASGAKSRIERGRVDQLRKDINEQKRAVLSLRSERDEASVLFKDVETAQNEYEAMSKRRTQLSTESQAELASARVLSPALEPLDHSKPNVPKNVLLSIIMGLLAGIVAAVGWEFLDRRVRSEDDMLAAEGVPVIGVLSAKPLDGRSRILPAPVKHRLPGGFAPQLTLDGGTS